MVKVDVFLTIGYNLPKDHYSLKETNLRMEKEVFDEVLEVYFYGQMGRGKDEREPNKKEEYTVKIGIDLSDDSVYTESDTGNSSMTCGIVMGFSKNLELILKNANLSAQPKPEVEMEEVVVDSTLPFDDPLRYGLRPKIRPEEDIPL